MEKRYFVFKKGYLNIDEDYFYFTDHGNWEKLSTLKETENPTLTLSYVLKYLLKTLILIIGITVLMYFYTKEVKYQYGIVLFILSIFHFFNRRSRVAKFKIPLNKVERLHVESDGLTVKFANSKNQQIIHTATLDDNAETEDIKKYLSEHFNHKYTIA